MCTFVNWEDNKPRESGEKSQSDNSASVWYFAASTGNSESTVHSLFSVNEIIKLHLSAKGDIAYFNSLSNLLFE